MKQWLKKFIPWSTQQLLRRKQHFASNERFMLANTEEFQTKLNQVFEFKQEPILFAGRLKSGNTWLRFLIYNYLNVLHNNAEETLTYHELNALQHDEVGDPKPIKGNPKPELFPYLVRTHHSYVPAFNRFKKGIYILRNPLDTLVSSFHFDKKHSGRNLRFVDDIDAHVLHNLILWEAHVHEYRQKKHFLTINYDALATNTSHEFVRVLTYLDLEIDKAAVEKSIALSNFENIKQMGRATGQTYGNGGINFKGEFARKGQVGGFKDELKPETVEKAYGFLKKHGLPPVDYLV